MSRVLVLYSTVDGHTARICERLRQHLEGAGHSVTLSDLDRDAVPELDRFEQYVIGASVRYGRHRPNVERFLREHRGLLERKPSGFFSVNIVARKPGKNTPETNPYARKLLARVGWRPRHAAVFAGRLDYPRYRFWDRQVIRFIMLLTRGPTDPRATVEFTDWAQVDAFAQRLAGR